MIEFLLILVFVSLGAIAVLVFKSNWIGRPKKTRYVCDLCGDHHCECTAE